jgi:ABC-type phosphate transport system substrate-binding protein
MRDLSRAGTCNKGSLYESAWLFFNSIPFVPSFVLAASRKKLESMKWFRPTCAIVAITLGLSIWQVKRAQDRYYENTLPYWGYNGPTIAGDESYVVPLPEPGFSSSLCLSEDLPRLDGATAFYPIYRTIARGIYRIGDEELQGYVNLSRTSEAYNRLIHGETDLIFVLQPSDEQIQAARDTGLELRLTPIAKEAFVFFVSERNPVSNLSTGQIQDIYQKKSPTGKDWAATTREFCPFSVRTIPAARRRWSRR